MANHVTYDLRRIQPIDKWIRDQLKGSYNSDEQVQSEAIASMHKKFPYFAKRRIARQMNYTPLVAHAKHGLKSACSYVRSQPGKGIFQRMKQNGIEVPFDIEDISARVCALADEVSIIPKAQQKKPHEYLNAHFDSFAQLYACSLLPDVAAFGLLAIAVKGRREEPTLHHLTPQQVRRTIDTPNIKYLLLRESIETKLKFGSQIYEQALGDNPNPVFLDSI